MRAQYPLFSLITIMALPLAAAADVDAIMQDCNGCHGDNGVSQWTDVPTIAGVAEYYQADAMYAFRDKARPCSETNYKQGDTSRSTDMCAVAGKLSDDDIDQVAAAYAGKDFVKAKQDFDSALADKGKVIHDNSCDRCHTEAGTNVDDEAGMLGGQWSGYLEQTLAEYRNGDREQPKKMEESLAALSDDDIKALVHYYASIQ